MYSLESSVFNSSFVVGEGLLLTYNTYIGVAV